MKRIGRSRSVVIPLKDDVVKRAGRCNVRSPAKLAEKWTDTGAVVHHSHDTGCGLSVSERHDGERSSVRSRDLLSQSGEPMGKRFFEG